jgi:hypothetical protein
LRLIDPSKGAAPRAFGAGALDDRTLLMLQRLGVEFVVPEGVVRIARALERVRSGSPA